MEFQCPLCQARFESDEAPETCPWCRASLTAQAQGPGFALLTGEPDEEPGAPEDRIPVDDPVLEDHARWRAGAIFAMVAGILGLLTTAAVTYGDYNHYGRGFFRETGNLAAVGGIGLLCLFFIAAGALVFRAVGRENQKYRQIVAQKQRAGKPPGSFPQA